MKPHLTDIAAAQHIRTQALALHVDGQSRLRGISSREKHIFLRMERHINGTDRSLGVIETWRSCLRSVHLNINKHCSKDLLPARDQQVRISLISQWIWEAGDAALSEQGLISLVACFNKAQPLTYAEIWLLPQAIRLYALRQFFEDTRILMAMLASIEAADNYLAGGKWRANDDFFAEAVFRRISEDASQEPYAAAKAAIESSGDVIEAAIDRAHEQQSALLLRFERAKTLLRLTDTLPWKEHLHAINHAERLLTEDPGCVYPRLALGTQREVRRSVSEVARRSQTEEWKVAQTAAGLCRNGKMSDLSQVFLTDDGLYLLQNELHTPDHAQYRLHSDPEGTWIIRLNITAFAVLMIICAITTESLLLSLCAVPLVWKAARLLFNRLAGMTTKTHPLPEISFEVIPNEHAALLVIPAKIASESELQQRMDEIEAYAALHTRDSLEYLLLADLPDADTAVLPQDDVLMERSGQLIAALNQAHPTAHFHVLWRERTFSQADGKYQPHERKRGALMDLYALLSGARSSFLPHKTAEILRDKRFRYVITLDAGTVIAPGSLQRLVGMMAWPSNRYAVIQPCMHDLMKQHPSRMDRLLSPEAGISAYAATVGDLYQDLTGRGIFGGKGIVDIAAFRMALEGRLPDNAILSHDLIEGALAGTAFAGDIAWFESQPNTLTGRIARFERWTRGDWQLLPFLLDRDQPLDALTRFQMTDNLINSLSGLSAMLLLIAGSWCGQLAPFALVFLISALPMLLHPYSRPFCRLLTALTDLCLLPLSALTACQAIVRALYRTYVSHEHMLDWKTSASADRKGNGALIPGMIAAVLLIPALRWPVMWLIVLPIGCLFILGPAWLENEEMPYEAPNALHERFLTDLAMRTWRWFETYVTEGDHHLPPDNVQLDPPMGAAHRTSPTNIGLYLLSCLCASKLGLADTHTVQQRIANTLATIESLPKWHGNLYNWYDTTTLQPLTPAYVSSVDSGNLAACLLCLSAADISHDLQLRAAALARDMQLSALYDPARELFHIGYDPENDTLSPSYYDLFASEARILSLIAIALGQIPAKHWQRLGRPVALVNGVPAYVSWSGTMFEYLMPDLLFCAPPGSAWSRTANAVIELQMDNAIDDMWGVSESGYAAFDLQMNYQYRAFGLKQLSFEGGAPGGVITPYAAALALKYAPYDAVQALMQMWDEGCCTEWGMIEAIDYRTGVSQKVMSHMAHHQGMLLCAIANAMCDNHLCRIMLRLPEIRAITSLMQEKHELHCRCHKTHTPVLPQAQTRPYSERSACKQDMHLMRGHDSCCILRSDGIGRLMFGSTLANRFLEDPEAEADGIGLFLHGDSFTGAIRQRDGIQSIIRPGSFTQMLHTDTLNATVTQCLSPESGAWIQQIELQNLSDQEQSIRLTSAFPVAMMTLSEMRAHPVFHNLFIHSRRVGRHAIGFVRRSREKTADHRLLVHLCSGADHVEWESDAERFYGRSSQVTTDSLVTQQLTGTLGHVLRPCSAIGAQIRLHPGETRTLHFCIGMTTDEGVPDWLKVHESASFAKRSLRFAEAQAQTLLSFIGIARDIYPAAEHCAAKLLFADRNKHRMPMKKRDLWQYGISGDQAMIGVRMESEKALDSLRDICRLHEFYRIMGISTDLIILYRPDSGYRSTITDRILEITQYFHSVHLLNMSDCPIHEAIYAACSIQFTLPGRSINDQLTAQCRLRRLHSLPPMTLNTIEPETLPKNGHGDFTDTGSYSILTSPKCTTPAPWCNILAGEGFGTLITERGGGFTWAGNSHDMRLTRFFNQTAREGWSEHICLVDTRINKRIDCLPYPENPLTFRVTHSEAATCFTPIYPEYPFEVKMGVYAFLHAKVITLQCDQPSTLQAEISVDWLMGTSIDDVRFLSVRSQNGICWAQGNMDGIGYLTCIDANPFTAQPDGRIVSSFRNGKACFVLGWAENEAAAQRNIDLMRSSGGEKLLSVAAEAAQNRFAALQICTPDARMNDFFNHFLPKQVFNSRLYGRTGLYQGGGAFGFRDQLQDMLCVLYFNPQMVRKQLLEHAAHQFESGDVMHWWHPPYRGVRTRISDDMLFLPYVMDIYIEETGDAAILEEEVPFLLDVPIPDDKEDLYFEAQPTVHTASMREHCRRAMERAYQPGAHGLLKIGTGDWNDGMNRVGAQGNGESIWLTQFLCHIIDRSLFWMDADESKLWLDRRQRMKHALETHGWDGEWYLRAYNDAGEKLGSHESEVMRIDCLSQAWAQIAGLDKEHTRSAVNAAKMHLIDEKLGIVRLLTPAFDMQDSDPGYIRAYPPGVRENGGQYTHAACWLLRALAQHGDADWAWKVLKMLLPYNHARTPEEADLYRVEPYVMAGDVSGEGENAGRGGWTWYTGSAAWLYRVFVEDLLGLKRRGNLVKMNLLPAPGWTSARIVLRCGSSSYTLESGVQHTGVSLDSKVIEGEWIELLDDGASHIAFFPSKR